MHVFTQSDVGLDPLAPCNIRRHHVSERLTVPPHRHAFTEISITLAGGAVHHHGQERQVLGPGSVIIVHRPEVHGFSQTRNWLMWDIFFLTEWMENGLGSLLQRPDFFTLFYESPGSPTAVLGGVRHFKLDREALSRLSVELSGSMAPPTWDRELAGLWRRNHVMNLLAILAESFARRHPTQLTTYPSSLGDTLAWIEAHPELSKAEQEAGIRSRLSLSERQVRRLFSKYLGEAPSSYLLRRKLRHAGTDLRLGQATVTTLAQRYGFYDAAHFSRAFKGEYGLAPQDYRGRFKPVTYAG